jgi:hypothetical protein
MVARAGRGTPPAIGWRSSGGHRLGGQGAAMSLGGGHGGEGGLRERSEWLVHAVTLGLVEQRSSSRRSASGRGLRHREPAFGAWNRGRR